MAAQDNSIHVPDDLRQATEAAAQAAGKTVDELFAEAAKRYLVPERLSQLDREGQERRRRFGPIRGRC